MELDEIRALADLARLDLAEDELDAMRAELGRLLEHFAALRSVDTDGVPPTPHPNLIAHRLREDRPAEVLTQDQVLAQAPASRAAQFLVPRVVDA
jgi:aspartyl-tRNA(Asn)/glutamyl-tRNA(Gln) amidotransferase subunit C